MWHQLASEMRFQDLAQGPTQSDPSDVPTHTGVLPSSETGPRRRQRGGEWRAAHERFRSAWRCGLPIALQNGLVGCIPMAFTACDGYPTVADEGSEIFVLAEEIQACPGEVVEVRVQVVQPGLVDDVQQNVQVTFSAEDSSTLLLIPEDAVEALEADNISQEQTDGCLDWSTDTSSLAFDPDLVMTPTDENGWAFTYVFIQAYPTSCGLTTADSGFGPASCDVLETTLGIDISVDLAELRFVTP